MHFLNNALVEKSVVLCLKNKYVSGIFHSVFEQHVQNYLTKTMTFHSAVKSSANDILLVFSSLDAIKQQQILI